jgi:iron complex transport system permease protein
LSAIEEIKQIISCIFHKFLHRMSLKKTTIARLNHSPHRMICWLLALSVMLMLFSACIGSTDFSALLTALLPMQNGVTTHTALQILFDLRLPRILGAWLVGALLGLSGSIAQGLFRNSLADPYLLGSASGAGLGVALAMAAWHGTDNTVSAQVLKILGVTGAAFIGAVLAVLIALLIARDMRQTMRLLLAGVVVSIVLAALMQCVFLKNQNLLAQSQFFMLGSVAYVNWNSFYFLAATFVLCLAVAMLLARVLDALCLGILTAQSLGVPIVAARYVFIIIIALATACSVAQTGLIAFVGLVSAHIIRAYIHCSYRYSLLLSSLMGGILLLAADTMARWLVAPQELPVGILTAIFGGGYLLWLIRLENLWNRNHE